MFSQPLFFFKQRCKPSFELHGHTFEKHYAFKLVCFIQACTLVCASLMNVDYQSFKMLSYLKFYAFQPFPWKMHICVPQSLWHGIHCTRCSGFQRPWLHLSCQFCWCLLLKYLFQLKRNGLQTSWTQSKLKKVEFSVNELNTVLTACRSQLFYCPCQVLVKNIIFNIFFTKNWFY